jgi:RNA-directed DNA polymerase
MDQKMLVQWLKAGFMWERQLFPTEAGTPQGGIISPVLANMTLDGLEELLHDRFRIGGRHPNPHRIHFIRYADDFVVTGESGAILEKVKAVISEFLAERGLLLSPEKTRIVRIGEGFDFLGWNVRKYRGKLLIKPSMKNVWNFLHSMRGTIKENATAKQISLIRLLNPKIRGWANYHRNQVSSDVFGYVDNRIWQQLWRWAKRRHSKKSSEWVWKKYFPALGNRNWLFNARSVSPKGEPRIYSLTQCGDVHIRRHRKIKGESNPFDPEWETYFEERFERQLRHAVAAKYKLRHLAARQDGICPVCRERICVERGWQIHHILKKCLGGTDSLDNLALLHPNCHRLIHSRGNGALPALRTSCTGLKEA